MSLFFRPQCPCAVLLSWLLLGFPTLAAFAAEDPLLTTFDTVLQDVVKMRQLTPQATVARAVHSRQQINASVQALIGEAYAPAEWEAERKAMVQWGLLKADFRLKDFIVELLTEQAAGYYDPKKRMFFIADWLPKEVQAPVMAHELVHALQDQHYDLQANFDLVKDQSDVTLARKALIEGDAVAVMFTYLLQPLGLRMDQLPDMQELLQASEALMGEQFQVYTKAPLILRQQLVFPYVHGLRFVKAALARGDWAGLDQVYRQPPLSTEQILHPEKYFTATPDVPRQISLAVSLEALQATWLLLKKDTLGEFLLSVVLQQFLPEAEALRSAAGWQGDRYVLLEQPETGNLLLLCVTAWDTPADAEEFFASYTQLLTHKYPDWSKTALDDNTGYVWQHGAARLLLRRQGQLVHVIEGAQGADLAHLQTLLEQATALPPTQR